MESFLVSDFFRLLTNDFELVGQGPHTLRFVRQPGFLSQKGRNNRSVWSANTIRRQCLTFFGRVQNTVFEYDVDDLDDQYNGAGERGTGGSKDTVPYWVNSQPIELVWTHVKWYVTRCYYPGRKNADLRRQI